MNEDHRIWEQISIFESNDFLGKWYTQRHGRGLNAARKREIGSNFTQGREYFHSAGAAAASVRPLLLYYGVLSLSRGVILLLDRNKKEENLKPSHGLEVVDWGATLSDGIENVLDLRVRATNGTFGELAYASKNRQATAWWSAPKMVIGSFSVEHKWPQFTSDKTVVTLDDLLSRDQRFLSLYERTTGRPTKVHLSEIVADGNGVEISVLPTSASARLNFSSAFGLPIDVTVARRENARRLPIPNYFFRLVGDDRNRLKPTLPVSQYVGNDGMFILEDFPNGDRMSELLRTFLISYILGMLVRYFPSRWIGLLRNEKGDVAQPILTAAVNAVERDFPRLVSEALG